MIAARLTNDFAINAMNRVKPKRNQSKTTLKYKRRKGMFKQGE